MYGVPPLSLICTALLCNHAPEVVAQAADALPLLPLATKAALLAILRRLLCAEQTAALADVAAASLADSFRVLDLSGCSLSDAGLRALAQRCGSLRELDVRCCANVTRALHCRCARERQQL